nr:hypothetical protein Iba_chr04dCG16750 [Ipomoea batatas]
MTGLFFSKIADMTGSGNSSRPADRAHLFCCRTVEGYLSSRDRVDIFHACEEVVLRRFQAPSPDLLLCSNRCHALVLCLHWTTAVLRLCVVVYSTESEARL